MNEQPPQDQLPDSRPETPQPMQDMREEIYAPSKTRMVILTAVIAGVVIVGGLIVLGTLFTPSVELAPLAPAGQTAFGLEPSAAGLPDAPASPATPAPAQPAAATPVAPNIAPVQDFR